MGKRKASAPPSTTAALPNSLVLQHGARSFLIAFRASYSAALDEALELFPKLDPDCVFLERELTKVGWVRLTESGWDKPAATTPRSDGFATYRVGEDSPSDEEDGEDDEEEPAVEARDAPETLRPEAAEGARKRARVAERMGPRQVLAPLAMGKTWKELEDETGADQADADVPVRVLIDGRQERDDHYLSVNSSAPCSVIYDQVAAERGTAADSFILTEACSGTKLDPDATPIALGFDDDLSELHYSSVRRPRQR
ncbi:hypothetical protein JCM10213_008126 [Rhodosporidiobolus nylandii]